MRSADHGHALAASEIVLRQKTETNRLERNEHRRCFRHGKIGHIAKHCWVENVVDIAVSEQVNSGVNTAQLLMAHMSSKPARPEAKSVHARKNEKKLSQSLSTVQNRTTRCRTQKRVLQSANSY